MIFDVLPRRSDFFPKTRRGHGTTHPESRFNKAGNKVREASPCVDLTCQRLMPKSKNLHEDRTANIKDWCDEHRVTVPKFRGEPGSAMVHATGGRA